MRSLPDAQSKADAIVAEAREKTQSMVTESEIMREATEQANDLLERTNQQAQEILDNATNDANNIRMGALQYTDDMLANLEKIMSHTIDGAGAKYSNFINAIQSCYDIVSKNRSELSPQGSTYQLRRTGDRRVRSSRLRRAAARGKLRPEEKADKEKSQGGGHNLGEHIFFQGETGTLENT